MNYRYKIQGEDFIFSQEEHDTIQNQIRTGSHALITFRSGRLGVDTSKVAVFKETEKLTDEQEKKNDEILTLNGKKWVEPTKDDYIRTGNIHKDFYHRMLARTGDPRWEWEKSSLSKK